MSNAKKRAPSKPARKPSRSAAPAASPDSGAQQSPSFGPIGAYPERYTRTVPPPAELARVPSPGAFCTSQLCLEMKYNLPFYLRKSDLMRFVRSQHDYWWGRYTQLYDKNAYSFPTNRTSSGWDYTNAAKEMLSRCKLFDSLFTQVMKIDLTHVNDFGSYCKQVFLELNKLKPAFPESPSSQEVFDSSVRDIMKFVLKQAPSDFDADVLDLVRLNPPAAASSDDNDD